jgi:hypothetical protein
MYPCLEFLVRVTTAVLSEPGSYEKLVRLALSCLEQLRERDPGNAVEDRLRRCCQRQIDSERFDGFPRLLTTLWPDRQTRAYLEELARSGNRWKSPVAVTWLARTFNDEGCRQLLEDVAMSAEFGGDAAVEELDRLWPAGGDERTRAVLEAVARSSTGDVRRLSHGDDCTDKAAARAVATLARQFDDERTRQLLEEVIEHHRKKGQSFRYAPAAGIALMATAKLWKDDRTIALLGQMMRSGLLNEAGANNLMLYPSSEWSQLEFMAQTFFSNQRNLDCPPPMPPL